MEGVMLVSKKPSIEWISQNVSSRGEEEKPTKRKSTTETDRSQDALSDMMHPHQRYPPGPQKETSYHEGSPTTPEFEFNWQKPLLS